MTVTVIDVDATTRKGREGMRAIVRGLAWDHAHDPYGSGMYVLGEIVNALWRCGEGVPSFISTGTLGPYPTGSDDVAQIVHTIESGEITTDDARYFMFVMSRYIDVVRLAGRDY